MPIFYLHRQYRRTCSECGTTWTVTRAAAKGIARSRAATDQRRSLRAGRQMGAQGAYYSAADRASRAADSHDVREVEAALMVCNRCGCARFTQEPVRDR